MEIIQAACRSGEETQFCRHTIKVSKAHSNMPTCLFKAMVEAAVAETGLDIALHLDHGADFEICKECIEAGFISNVTVHTLTMKRMLQRQRNSRLCTFKGVVVEAELGKLAGA